MRPDYGAVVTAVLDFLLNRPGTDPDRVALIGLSLAASSPRERRPRSTGSPPSSPTAARWTCVRRRCGAHARPAGRRSAGGKRWARFVAGRLTQKLAAEPTAGWALRRGMLVHGAATPLAYFDALKDYSNAGYAGQITCPTYVTNAEADDVSASAPKLADALRCPHQFRTFTTAEGAGDHCEAGARTLFHARGSPGSIEIMRPGTGPGSGGRG